MTTISWPTDVINHGGHCDTIRDEDCVKLSISNTILIQIHFVGTFCIIVTLRSLLRLDYGRSRVWSPTGTYQRLRNGQLLLPNKLIRV